MTQSSTGCSRWIRSLQSSRKTIPVLGQPGMGGQRRIACALAALALLSIVGCEPTKTQNEISGSGTATDTTSQELATSEATAQPPSPPEPPIPEPAPVRSSGQEPIGGAEPTGDAGSSDGKAVPKEAILEKADETVPQAPSSEPARTSEPATSSDSSSETASTGQGAASPRNRFLPPNRNPQTANPSAKTAQATVEDRKAREAAKKRGEITFDDLKFEMEKGAEFKNDMLGSSNWELHEKVWKIRGFILPTTLFSQTGITEFVLVRDNQECCFGPGAALYDCIIVKMVPGKTINYTTRVVSVKGKLEIDTESFQYPDDGGHYAVYKMTAEEVK
ncbi:hypothetical protein VN12_22910 [Pirellula sp. SH-Sr6A]|uniref:DUF3299 domain-containing protein n=1 Tax=Pirellula sp. SH-Sr6A TaxID=1632865 RepID=UPI00078B259F|nr:DUF3299 domain-containing protein [Pirellula sp. SH-Sr6A]AMV34995.1 hypothetical protein VN12_22910 [Pirellula sp. SH-Sr6A]